MPHPELGSSIDRDWVPGRDKRGLRCQEGTVCRPFVQGRDLGQCAVPGAANPDELPPHDGDAPMPSWGSVFRVGGDGPCTRRCTTKLPVSARRFFELGPDAQACFHVCLHSGATGTGT